MLLCAYCCDSDEIKNEPRKTRTIRKEDEMRPIAVSALFRSIPKSCRRMQKSDSQTQEGVGQGDSAPMAKLR